jgi:membrane protein required for colicin V production
VTVVDIVIIAVLAAGVLGGIRQGFIMQVATILGAVVALGVAKLEYRDVRQYLAHVASGSQWLTVISYLIVFLVIWGAVVVIARRIRTLARFLLLGWLDRIGGAIVGLLQGLLLVDLLLYLGKRLPNSALHHAIKHSLLGPSFSQVFPYINHWFPHVPH